jgi:hypothetical protein
MIRTISACIVFASLLAAAKPDPLADGFRTPPQEARPRVYWVWLHDFDKSRITFDLEQMKKQGIGGFLHWESGAGPSRFGTRAIPFPAGTAWMSPEWRDGLRHAFKEADRLGLEVSLSMTPGANCGGPWITPELSGQRLVMGFTSITGPLHYSEVLPTPDGVARTADGKPLGYHDIGVFAAEPSRLGHMRWVVEGAQLFPTEKLDDIPLGNPWIDVTSKVDASGRLTWDVPPGAYRIMRIGYAPTNQSADYARSRDSGLYADHMRKESVELNMRTMFDQLFGKEALPRSLKYIYCDSLETYNADWTPGLLDEFRQRRGYDPWRFLPTLDGGNIETRAITARFRSDLNKTRSDAYADNHYQLLMDLAHERGLGFHSESAGPRVNPQDWLKLLGRNDMPMGEFWIKVPTHRVTVDERFYVKGPASAAHIYGHRYVAAESFTSIGGQWEEDPWTLKPDADQAFLEGVNRMFLHTFSHSPDKYGKPGIEYFAGTHFNPNITWWNQAHAWTDYLARCQHLLSQGLFVGDVLYYYGDQVPAVVQHRHTDPSLGAGYDYDVVNAEVILKRLSVRDGRLVLPDGMSYRVLVLPAEWKSTQLDVLQKIAALVEAGATVVGAPPAEASGLEGFPTRDAEVRALAKRMWGEADGTTITENRYGNGRVIWGRPLRKVMIELNVAPDFETRGPLQAIHRSTPDGEIYFVVNQSERAEDVECAFRVTGKEPELWDPATGTQSRQLVYSTTQPGRTRVPLKLAPRGSVFVVFRNAAHGGAVASVAPAAEIVANEQGTLRLRAAKAGHYTAKTEAGQTASVDIAAPPAPVTLAGPWKVSFTPGWGAPESATFDKLVSWTERPEAGIKYFSGSATYETTFDAPAADHLELDLGEVSNLAEVRLNGHDLGVLWKVPFRVDVTGLTQPRGNRLEVRVTNLWTNRMIGDESLADDKRFTHANMLKFTAQSELRRSGLLGPVQLVPASEARLQFNQTAKK